MEFSISSVLHDIKFLLFQLDVIIIIIIINIFIN